MTMNLWMTKLAARIHDPAEKALVLLRDPSGHERGSIVGVGKALGFKTRPVRREWKDGSVVEYEELDLDQETKRIVKQADQWAAAADRPQFPRDANERYPEWAQVRFASEGKLIHPLTGESYDLWNIGDSVLAEHIKKVSEDLFINELIQKDGTSPDLRRTLLAFWRFGPELGRKLDGIGHVWSLLPADTRVPDHTIWQHLDLTSALTGAMAGGRPALLTISIGPVQDFIAAGRSSSDLWAGSHFLSMLSWQAIQVVAEALGPDAIVFPQLRGVPVVDLWLIKQGVERRLFDQAPWTDQKTDYNPLFSAALPNKFVAIVPEQEGRDLAHNIEATVRGWVQSEARAMLDMALKVISEVPAGQHCYGQLERQLKNFPEVHWSLVPWLPEAGAREMLAAFYPEGIEPEFFSKTWTKLNTPVEPEAGWTFWQPNDGALYPAVHDCGERLLGAAKSLRSFDQLQQEGFRDSLTGEYEWLTLEEKQLALPPGQREATLWTRLAERKPSWVKQGEHLSAFGLIKRVWPARYLDWLKEQGIKTDLTRYVVSTHVMALAPSLEKLMRYGPNNQDEFRKLAAQIVHLDRAALPRKLMKPEYRENEERWAVAARLPTLLDDLRQEAGDDVDDRQLQEVQQSIEKAIGIPAENYYALILMDGDRLGAWLSGEFTLKFRQAFHPKVREGIDRYNDDRLRQYLGLSRPVSPAGHMAISAALNSFSLDLARYVVEDVCLGKLLYCGGDDVMAMVCVRDLLKALWLLRLVYSGGTPAPGSETLFGHDLDVRRGFVRWGDRLYRVMGELATASAGAVIAHHMMPLATVIRNLRGAEQDAKRAGGRNAFSIRVLKRSGGRQDFTLPWWIESDEDPVSSIAVLEEVRTAIAKDVSRRVAYHVSEWLRDFPLLDDPKELEQLIACNVQYQFERKTHGSAIPRKSAERLAFIGVHEAQRRMEQKKEAKTGDLARIAYDVIGAMLSTAEFLAREARGEAENEQPAMEAQHG